MKLSEFRKLLSLVERAAIESNPDPDVRFWVPRLEGHPAGPLDSNCFVEYAPDDVADFQQVLNHRVDAPDAGAVRVAGDFCLALHERPFYKSATYRPTTTSCTTLTVFDRAGVEVAITEREGKFDLDMWASEHAGVEGLTGDELVAMATRMLQIAQEPK